MIHFTCDACGRSINTEEETRYVVRLEVYAAIDESCEAVDPEEDQLSEIDDLLERLAEGEEQCESDDLYRQARYDLCPECRKRFLENPLGINEALRLRFSKN